MLLLAPRLAEDIILRPASPAKGRRRTPRRQRPNGKGHEPAGCLVRTVIGFQQHQTLYSRPSPRAARYCIAHPPFILDPTASLLHLLHQLPRRRVTALICVRAVEVTSRQIFAILPENDRLFKTRLYAQPSLGTQQPGVSPGTFYFDRHFTSRPHHEGAEEAVILFRILHLADDLAVNCPACSPSGEP